MIQIKTGVVVLKYFPAVVKLVDLKANEVNPFQINGYSKSYSHDYFADSLVLLDEPDAISLYEARTSWIGFGWAFTFNYMFWCFMPMV